MLLEVIIDQYLYSLNDKEVEELEGIIVNEFGYDQNLHSNTLQAHFTRDSYTHKKRKEYTM